MSNPVSRRSVLSSIAAATAVHTLGKSSALVSSFHAPIADDSSPLHDPLRPAFHYLPARNWMNDPCAPVFWRGEYHMFHQYNPNAAVWGDMHWAHATSPDMVHWQRRPVAIAPTPGGPDSEGVFTGSSILHNGAPAIIYTGVQTVSHAEATLSDGTHNFRETQLLATASDPGLNTWTKHPQPVIPTPPPGLEVTGFRDPTPFTYAGRQYLIVGSGVRGKGGMALLYRAPKLPGGSHDLTRWEYLHPLAEGTPSSPSPRQGTPNPTKSTPTEIPKDPVDTGEMWECPDFFSLDGRHVLIYSTIRKTFWQVGDLDPATLRFHATATGQLDQGRSFYAPKTQLDAHGNRILWGWLAETRPEAEFAAAGWAGMLSLPRILTIQDGHLYQNPLPALQQLRRSSLGSPTNEYTATLTRKTPEQPWEKQNGPQRRQGSSLRDAAGPLLTISNSEKNELLLTGPEFLSVKLDREFLPEGTNLHVFVDSSVIELFVAGQCFTYRFYHRTPGVAILSLHLPRGSSLTHTLTYTLQPIWPS